MFHSSLASKKLEPFVVMVVRTVLRNELLRVIVYSLAL
jgi:hypothetical protein